MLAAVTALASSLPSFAQSNRNPELSLPIVRDTEIEVLLKEYMAPVLRVSGVHTQNIDVVLINNRAFNAFVADGRRIFVFTGTLLDSRSPNEVIGVLAHETGHIAGGHLARLRQQLAAAQNASIVAFLLSLGAMAAGAATSSRDSNFGAVAGGIIAGPQEAIRRSVLAYQRAEEQSADRAAVSYLEGTGQSARGMLETFRRIADQSMFLTRGVDPYTLSHPLAQDRIAQLETLVNASKFRDRRDSPELQARHELMRAKLVGFTERGDAVMRRYPPSDTSLPARYARAISAYRFGDIRASTALIDALIAAQPNNPYFHELKGQALLENARPREAVAPLRKAVSLAPRAPLIRILLGQALIATNDKAVNDEAIQVLSQALQGDTTSADGFRQLAIAYGRRGDLANADLASAQAAFAQGDFLTARQLANRAKGRFSTGSPGWVRADDILTYRPPNLGGRT